jgi:glycerol-3-phosphate dehydrogenase subunit C
MLKIRISRFDPEVDRVAVFKEYEVPCVEQGTVLEGLLYIYENIDSTLFFNYGCRYRLCGKCAVKINGKPGLACETPLVDGTVLEPLDNLPLIRDLGVDRSGLLDDLRRHQVVLATGARNEPASQPTEFLNLIRCNECLCCLSQCPAYGADVGYGGPFLGVKLASLYRDVREEGGRLSALESFTEPCALCKQCETVCPWGVQFPSHCVYIRSKAFSRKRKTLRDWLLTHPDQAARLASCLPGAGIMRTRAVRKILDGLLGIDRRAAFPAYHSPTIARGERMARGKGNVAYFLGCYEKFNDPETAEAGIALLESAGAEVAILDPGCCGLPFLSVGDLDSARRRAKNITAILKNSMAGGRDIVFSCPSCESMVKKDFPALFHLLDGEDVQKRIFNLGEYLRGRSEGKRRGVQVGGGRSRVGYQVSCHLKSLKIGTPFLDLIKSVPGLEVVEVFDQCCGMAGTMGFKKEKFEQSRKMGEELICSIKNCHLDLILSECAACRMKISQEAEIETMHPAQFLQQALIPDRICN